MSNNRISCWTTRVKHSFKNSSRLTLSEQSQHSLVSSLTIFGLDRTCDCGDTEPQCAASSSETSLHCPLQVSPAIAHL